MNVNLLRISACHALAIITNPRRKLTLKVRHFVAGVTFFTSIAIVLTNAQAQTFKAIPLDCGGWFSGFAQADNGRLYGYGDVFGAWRSNDGGSSWNYLNWGIPGGDIVGYGMAVQKDNADVVYYSTNRGLWKSTNGGSSWTVLLSDVGIDANNGAPRYRGSSPILIRSNNPNEIWFAGPRKGLTGWLWKSPDGGSNWEKVGGSTFDTNEAKTLHNVATFANQIWIGSTNGLYVSTNGGTSFNLVGNSTSLADVGMISRFTTGTFAGVGLVTRSNNGGGGISRITATDYNNSATYTVTDAATWALYFGYPTGLQIFSDGSSSAWNTSADRHGFSPAGNGGQTFTRRATTLNTVAVPIWSTAAEMTAKNHPDYGSDQVIEAVGNPNKWIITGGKAPMYSLDKGLSWQYFPNGNGIAGVKTWLAGVSRYDANRIYIPAADIGSVIVTDGGSSGQASLGTRKSYIDKLHSTFRIMEGPNTQDLVVAGVDQGSNANLVLKSANGGSTWSVLNITDTGLPSSVAGITKSVMSITDANDFMVVLGEDGSTGQRVYRTTNGGISFSGVSGLPDNSPSGSRTLAQSCFIERDAILANVRYFVARGQNLFKSTNSGANWSVTTHPFGVGSWVWCLAADPIRSNNLWAAGEAQGIKVSRDGGLTWNSTAQSFNARYVSSCDGKIAVFGSMVGDAQPRLYYSADDGATFTAQTNATNNFHAVSGITVDRNGKIWVSWNSVTVVTPVIGPPTNDTQTPSIPTSLSSSSITSNSFTLNWAASTDNVGVTGYEVFRGGSSIGTPTGTSFNVGGLSANTSYNMTVRARDAAGNNSGVSAVLTVTTSAATGNFPIITSRGENLPNEGNIKAFDLDNNSKWLDFNTSSFLQIQYQNATTFNQYTIVSGNDSPERDPVSWTIQGSNNGSNWTTLDTRTGQSWANRNLARTFIFTNSNAYSYYKMNITANSNGNIIQLSELTYGTTGGGGDTQQPSIPTALQSSAITSNSFNLSWTASADNVGVTGYDIYRGSTLAGSTSGTSINVTGLSASTTYSITVRAKDAAGNVSIASSALNVTTSSGGGGGTSYPIITARGDNSPNEGKDKAFDLNNNSKWLDFNSTSFLQIQYQNATTFNQYIIVSGNDSPERDPVSWTIQGSNNGSSWTTFDTRTGQSWASRNLARTFTFTNSIAYSYYRMNITANTTGNIIQLSELTYGNSAQTGGNKVMSAVNDARFDIKNPNSNSIQVYPNPVTDGSISISQDPDNTGSPVFVTIMDLAGRIVFKNRFISNGVTQLVDIKTLSSGVYVINLKSKYINYTTKIIVR